MNENKNLNFLDEIDEESKSSNKNTRMVMFVLGVAVVGIFLTFLWGRSRATTTNSQAKVAQVKDSKAVQTETQYGPITDFAERFVITAFDVSYGTINRQVDRVTGLMTDNLMSYYQEAFLDQSWVSFLTANKAYVSYQKIERSSVMSEDGNHYWVKVIGVSRFYSDKLGLDSSIDLPMNLIVVVKNDNGVLQISNFERF
jgi:hypothetical protein